MVVITFMYICIANEDKKILMSGINAFTKYTCIKFVPRTSDQTDYVLFAEHISGYCFVT